MPEARRRGYGMVTRQIEISEEQARSLEEMAARQGRPVSDLIRAGIDAVLRTEASREDLKRRARELSGRFRSGVSDLSTEHDRYLEKGFGD
jgi:Arc/MetJ-type ribon-helix-helix transcriptional regulator